VFGKELNFSAKDVRAADGIGWHLSAAAIAAMS
jgi:hypothetical protein